ncbi:MAG: hypothetical protein N2483_00260, partial [Burkholderiaceae bacterium]|nr:hypothetical protein [Burkholderiaceae bacterium]
PGLQPRLETGRSAVLFSGLCGGIEGRWVLSGLSGDNVFAATIAGAPGRIGAAPTSASFGSLPSGSAPQTVSSTVNATPLGVGLSSTVTIAGGRRLLGPAVELCLSAQWFEPGHIGNRVDHSQHKLYGGDELYTGAGQRNDLVELLGADHNRHGPGGSTVFVTVPYSLSGGPIRFHRTA